MDDKTFDVHPCDMKYIMWIPPRMIAKLYHFRFREPCCTALLVYRNPSCAFWLVAVSIFPTCCTCWPVVAERVLTGSMAMLALVGWED